MCTFSRATEITLFAFERFLSCVCSHVSLHVRLDLELGIAIETGKRSIACVLTQVNNQLTGGATGVGTRLTSVEMGEN